MKPVVKQDWLESEAGWGMRPDGYTLHLTEADRVKFIEDYWKRMPDAIPDEYSRPSGSPTVKDVDSVTYAEIQASKNGKWY